MTGGEGQEGKVDFSIPQVSPYHRSTDDRQSVHGWEKKSFSMSESLVQVRFSFLITLPTTVKITLRQIGMVGTS